MTQRPDDSPTLIMHYILLPSDRFWLPLVSGVARSFNFRPTRWAYCLRSFNVVPTTFTPAPASSRSLVVQAVLGYTSNISCGPSGPSLRVRCLFHFFSSQLLTNTLCRSVRFRVCPPSKCLQHSCYLSTPPNVLDVLSHPYRLLDVSSECLSGSLRWTYCRACQQSSMSIP